MPAARGRPWQQRCLAVTLTVVGVAFVWQQAAGSVDDVYGQQHNLLKHVQWNNKEQAFTVSTAAIGGTR